MGQIYQVFLDGETIYICSSCHTHIATHEDIISKSFHGRHGKAYLFDNAANITMGDLEDRLLMTGLHSVADIYCTVCQANVGWKYVHAFEESQKYKEGKFIIERAKIAKVNCWDDKEGSSL
ncbi:hypothetical protein K7432_012082 [Basidiobolus ranarum]|uniref:Protein yippee-like n=1 Tax=Basidiobolus ranarum TaxID=34480 RepID=A0ABR2VSU1_9FUNG